MAATNAEIITMLSTRYPVFAAVDSGRLSAFVDDARVVVPLCRLSTAQGDLALMYKTASLASVSPDLSSTLAAGSVKRMRDGDVEVEYQATGTSASVSATNPFEALYQAIVRTAARNSPRVLGYRG